MESLSSRDAADGRKDQNGWFPIVVLVAIGAILLTAWPAYRSATRVGLMALIRPLLHNGGWLEKGRVTPASIDHPKVDSPAQGMLARYARSMEFRVQRFRMAPSLLHEWNAEWKPDAPQKIVMLSLLLRQLPGAAAQKDSAAQKNLADCILELMSEGRQTNPDNAFFQIAESLVRFYSEQEMATLDALKQDGPCARADAALRELNQSETELWSAEKKPWTLFAVTPRIWGIEFKRSLHVFSRMMASREKAALKKYNLERAVELSLLQLELAARIADASWTASDAATARAIANRAMEPFWTQKDVNPTASELEEHFASFLDDQGDKTLAGKFRFCMEQIVAREQSVSGVLPHWRRVQQLTSWNAPGLLGCLLLQTASLLLTWSTLALSTRSPAPPSLTSHLPVPHRRGSPFTSHFAMLAFSIAPLVWMISNWPAGGSYMMASLVGSWVLWWGILRTNHSPANPAPWRTSLAAVTVMMLTTTLLVTSALSLILEYHARHLNAMLQHGWLI